MKSFKIGVKTPGDTDWVYNGLRFPTREAAEEYGANLAFRWTAVIAWEVHESDEPPNQ